MIDPIRLEFDVNCSAVHAFTIWTARTSTWWPADHTVSAEPGVTVVFEPHVGGRIFERTKAGVEHDWGRIVGWDPPRRLVYRWHLGFDASDETEVDISFEPQTGDRTLVQIEHRGWELLGASGASRREGNIAGWGGVLPFFIAAAAVEADLAGWSPGA
jgi:uncharacterized protein YndB with AHSA1/START domain